MTRPLDSSLYPGSEPPKFRDGRLLAAFGAFVLALALGAVLLVLALEPETGGSGCRPPGPCATPSDAHPAAAGELVRWRGRSKVQLDYDSERWRAVEDEPGRLVLEAEDGKAWLDLRIGSGAGDPTRLPGPLGLGERLDTPALHRPSIGYVVGDGAWHTATALDGSHPRGKSTVATISVVVGDVTLDAAAGVAGSKEEAFSQDGRARREAIDSILNTVTVGGGDASVAIDSGDPATAWTRAVVKAYGISKLRRQTARSARGVRVLPGDGETIALISFDGFRDEDVAVLDRVLGIKGAPDVEPVSVSGQRLEPGPFAQEVSIGIGAIRAVAPGARILSYETTRGWPEMLEAVKSVNEEGRASIVSLSWGACHAEVPSKLRRQIEEQLAHAADRGTTIFVASGDAGAYACLGDDRSELRASNHREIVDWPAASPHVVAVGGTRLFVDARGRYVREAAWEDSLSNRASGGGMSPVSPRPVWQQAPGIASAGARQVPDVVGPADCDNGFFVVYPSGSATNLVQAQGATGCGTSAAAPFWAALTALLQQYARAQGYGRLPFLGEVLYELAGTHRHPPFHDVSAGGNLLRPAAPGWDAATGLGSPQAWNLARELVALLDSRRRPAP